MKKIFTLVVMAVMAVAASAQLYVGGEVSAWRNDGDHTTTASILPEIGYNLDEQWAVGTTIGWQHAHQSGINNNLVVFHPYARYTFFKSGIVSIFCDGTAGFGAGKTSWDGGHSDTAWTWQIGFRPGVAFKCSDRFSVVAHFGFLGYNGANDAAKEAGYADEWGLRFSGNDLSLGFYVNF